MTVFLQFLVTWGAATMIWVAISALVAVPTAILWNWLMPGIFNLPEIGYAQAFGLLVLSSLLFSSRNVTVETNN